MEEPVEPVLPTLPLALDGESLWAFVAGAIICGVLLVFVLLMISFVSGSFSDKR